MSLEPFCCSSTTGLPEPAADAPRAARSTTEKTASSATALKIAILVVLEPIMSITIAEIGIKSHVSNQGRSAPGLATVGAQQLCYHFPHASTKGGAVNILFVVKEFPHSQVIGGPIIIYNRIKYLSERHTVSCIAFAPHEPTDEQVESLDRFCKELRPVSYTHLTLPTNREVSLVGLS